MKRFLFVCIENSNRSQMAQAFAGTPDADLLVRLSITTPALAIMFMAPLAGWAIDRLGRLRILYASMLLYSAAGVASASLALAARAALASAASAAAAASAIPRPARTASNASARSSDLTRLSRSLSSMRPA